MSTWQLIPRPREWIAPPAPRLINRGIQGGTFTLDQPDGQWKSVLKLESRCPDAPAAPGNDHYRTIYTQTTRGPIERSVPEEESIVLGVVLRFSFGIGNGQMKTIYDVVPNGINHAAITGESVEVDAATVRVFYDGPYATEITVEELDAPIPIRADDPPTLTIGVIQNQSLAMNQIATPKRMLSVTVPPALTVRVVPVPFGAQSVTILGNPRLLASQRFGTDGSGASTLPLPINLETPLIAGAYEIDLRANCVGFETVAGVVFGLGL